MPFKEIYYTSYYRSYFNTEKILNKTLNYNSEPNFQMSLIAFWASVFFGYNLVLDIVTVYYR